MNATANTPIGRTIRRQQLREMVPLADSTIYEMEQRGEFPRRFALTPRCVVWDLGEVLAWLAARRAKPILHAPRRPAIGEFKTGKRTATMGESMGESKYATIRQTIPPYP